MYRELNSGIDLGWKIIIKSERTLELEVEDVSEVVELLQPSTEQAYDMYLVHTCINGSTVAAYQSLLLNLTMHTTCWQEESVWPTMTYYVLLLLLMY
jgi:hypothetical protein